MRQIPILDFINLPAQTLIAPKLINVRGCNGSGKSTIPMRMMEQDPDTFEVYWMYESTRFRVIATVFPKFQTLALGHYHAKTGGMDTITKTQEIKDAVEMFWKQPYHILMEGAIASTVRQTYIDLFQTLSATYKREVIIYNILPPLQTCLQRIQKRNGGKEIKEELVESKWKTVQRNVQHFADAGFNSLVVDNSGIPREKTLDWFFGNIGVSYTPHEYLPNILPTKVPQTASQSNTTEFDDEKTLKNLYIRPSSELVNYDWYPDYKEPDANLEVVQKYFNSYWNFIAERMNIWYKRVMLKEPAPWTDDKILRNFKFTNVIRDLDKLSIWERRNILSKIDEPTSNLELRKKSVLLNIMIFRLWVKIDTYLVHGFIDLENPHWRQEWDAAKEQLLERREQGVSNFTAAYYVNDLRAANPDPNTRSNKTANAIAMIEDWMNRIDEIYQNAIVDAEDMKAQMEYFKTLPCVGDFTAYEYACSITEITRYCKHYLVTWTQDNATNVGPGAKRGINWIFKNKGGMSDYQCILYLRSIWEHELKQRGTYERFVSQLPKELNGDIDLRVIEHCLCETQKYNKAWTNTGRPKETFKPHTLDMNELKG